MEDELKALKSIVGATIVGIAGHGALLLSDGRVVEYRDEVAPGGDESELTVEVRQRRKHDTPL